MSIIRLCAYCADTDCGVKRFDEFGNQIRSSNVRRDADIYLCEECRKVWKKTKKAAKDDFTKKASQEFSAWLRTAPNW